MQVRVTTRLVMRPMSNKWPLMVLDIDLLPKGGGNRAAARRLAQAWRDDGVMSPFVEKIITGTSRVRVHLTCSADLNRLMQDRIAAEREREREKRRDVQGQQLLFGV